MNPKIDGQHACENGGLTIGATVLPAAGALFVSHGISFFRNYIGRREYERSSLLALMFWPYARLAMMAAVTITGLLGVRLVPAFLRLPLFTCSIILLKLLGDFATHRMEHGARG